MGLHACALSRFAGRVVGHEDDPGDRRIVQQRLRRPRPRRHRAARGLSRCPTGGLHIRWPDAPLEQEARLMDHKWYAALAYVRANKLNHNVIERPERPLRPDRQRQGLQRHAPGAARPGPDDDALPRARHPAAQGQRGLAAGGHHHARLCPGPAGDPGGRGKAPGHRIPAEGRALQLARRCAPHTCSASSTRPRATNRAASGRSPTPAATGCCAPRPT